MDVEPASPTNPKIPGMDFSGTIHAVGSKVDKSRFAVGDEVFGLAMDITGKGTMQQYLAMTPAPAGDEQGSHVVIKKPESLTPTQAAALPLVYSTIYTGFVHYGHLTYPSNATHNQAPSTTSGKEKSVLILGGSGGTGSMAIQFAKQIPEVAGRIVTSCSGKNADFVKSLGAAEVCRGRNGVWALGLNASAIGHRLYEARRCPSSTQQPIRAIRPRIRLRRRIRLYPAPRQAARQ